MCRSTRLGVGDSIGEDSHSSTSSDGYMSAGDRNNNDDLSMAEGQQTSGVWGLEVGGWRAEARLLCMCVAGGGVSRRMSVVA